MASIIKRKKNYSVVYNYVDENGETKQKWETWHTHKEALKRKAEIENQQHTGTFLPPSNQTITEFLYDFVSLYGEKKWGVSMYDGQTALLYPNLTENQVGVYQDPKGRYHLCQRQDH